MYKLPIEKANKYKDPRFKNKKKFYIEEEKTDTIENLKERAEKSTIIKSKGPWKKGKKGNIEAVKHGLKSWVKDYKDLRLSGNVSLAKKVRDNIDAKIKKYKLDRNEIYGPDPDKPVKVDVPSARWYREED